MVGPGRYNLPTPLFAKLVKSLQWKRKIQCGNSCGRMLTLFEIVGAVFFYSWCGNGVPTSLFQHYTPAYNNIFLFHSIENCDISSWTRAVLQPAETFLMSRCNILRKAHTASVHYTVLVKHLLCNWAWQDFLILFVDTQICYFHMPGWQMKRHKFDFTKSGLKEHCLGFIESDYIFNPLY